MRVSIWTSQDFLKDIKAKKIWIGELNLIPRIGDFIQIPPAECLETIKNVSWILEDNEVEICVNFVDYLGFYNEFKNENTR